MHRRCAGEHPDLAGSSSSPGLAQDIAGFLKALHKQRLPGMPSARRGVPLRNAEAETLRALAVLAAEKDQEPGLNTAFLGELWESACSALPYTGDPVPVHGDLLPGNILLNREGRLAAVIDWSETGAGDPACDLVVAWSVLEPRERDMLRHTLCPQNSEGASMWQRGKGWALSIAVIMLPYYRSRNPFMAALARRIIGQLSRPDTAT